jgi:hypothetical protein
MSYMLLVMEPPAQRRERNEAQAREAWDRMTGFAGDLQQRGLLKASESLRIDSQIRRVEKRDGRTRVLDGPFAEAKEIIGGFFLLNCDSQEEAMALARECPAAEWATVEVRRVGACFEDSL